MSNASVVVSTAPFVTFVQIQVLTTIVLPDDRVDLRATRPAAPLTIVIDDAQLVTSTGKMTSALPLAERVTVMPPLLLMTPVLVPPLMRAQYLAAASPRSPAWPRGPLGPLGRPPLKSPALIEWFLMSAEATAPFLICLEPTLLAGSLMAA